MDHRCVAGYQGVEGEPGEVFEVGMIGVGFILRLRPESSGAVFGVFSKKTSAIGHHGNPSIFTPV